MIGGVTENIIFWIELSKIFAICNFEKDCSKEPFGTDFIGRLAG